MTNLLMMEPNDQVIIQIMFDGVPIAIAQVDRFVSDDEDIVRLATTRGFALHTDKLTVRPEPGGDGFEIVRKAQ